MSGWDVITLWYTEGFSLTLIGNIVTLSGESILYHTHRFPLFWATTTSLRGTHGTYVQ